MLFEVLWIHVLVVWLVSFLTTRQLQLAMQSFVLVRYRWLRSMSFPQCTSVLVEGIPDDMCSDQRLQHYFADLFGENAVVRCYVVRNTRLLKKKLERLRKATRTFEKMTRTALKGIE